METPYVCYGNNCVTSLPLVVPACFYLLQQLKQRVPFDKAGV